MSPENGTPAFLQRVESAFHRVLEAPEPEWAAILEDLCRDDPALMAEVLSLLAAFQAGQAGPAERPGAGPSAPPRRVGPYLLDRPLGRGGMGSVHLAHRDDGQFRQQVAIKLIDLPLTTELFRERFRQERQILAGLDHPYIARLLDGGVTADGELFLAMEYVDGLPIARYCRDNRLTLRDRLGLFGKVCAAVHHAHQNLVVHRDLKSDNILVLADGTPKLLDFGTAKLLAPGPGADAASDFTRLGLQSFTPNYASPEQVLGETITTASDSYSLGVLLFLLLAEVPPYVLKEGSTAELLRVVCTETPPRPSSVAAMRLDGDLDAIVLKALRKEPEARYRSVDAFAADIQAYLEGRPVPARHGTLRYRAAKFARRNRLALGAAGLLAASLAAGLAGVLWQFRVARQERNRSEARSEDLRQLSNSLLSEIDEAVKQLPGATPVRRLLVTRVLEHLDRMARDVKGDRRTRLDLVGAYTRLANLQGNPYDPNLGDPEGALVSLEKALALAGSLDPAGGDPDLVGALALARQSRSEVLFGIGRTAEAIVSMRAAVAAFRARTDVPGATAAQFADAATACGGLGDQLGQSGVASLGDPAGAIQAYREGLELSLRSLAADPGFARSRRAVAIEHYKIGNVLSETDPLQAIGEYRQSLAAWAALPAADPSGAAVRRGAAMTSRKLGLALVQARDYGAALAALREARNTYEAFAAADPKDTRAQFDLSIGLSNEAEAHAAMLDPALAPPGEAPARDARAAVALLERSVAILTRLVATNPDNPGWVTNLAYDQVVAATLRQAHLGQAGGSSWAVSGVAALRAAGLRSDAGIPTLDHAVSALLTVRPTRLRDPALAVQFAERLAGLTRRRKPDFLLSLAQALRAAGQAGKARAAAAEGLALLPALPPGGVRPRLRILLEAEAGRGCPGINGYAGAAVGW